MIERTGIHHHAEPLMLFSVEGIQVRPLSMVAALAAAVVVVNVTTLESLLSVGTTVLGMGAIHLGMLDMVAWNSSLDTAKMSWGRNHPVVNLALAYLFAVH